MLRLSCIHGVLDIYHPSEGILYRLCNIQIRSQMFLTALNYARKAEVVPYAWKMQSIMRKNRLDGTFERSDSPHTGGFASEI